jgi:hypothetical protein
MAAIAELKSRGAIQRCWSQRTEKCARVLYADAPRGHKHAITLGHFVAIEDGGDPFDPNNYGPECGSCNYGDGARRTNAKKRGVTAPVVKRRKKYRNPRW